MTFIPLAAALTLWVVYGALKWGRPWLAARALERADYRAWAEKDIDRFDTWADEIHGWNHGDFR